MICPMVPFPLTFSDPYPRFQGHGVIFMPINALSVLYAQLSRDLLAIAKFLFVKIWRFNDFQDGGRSPFRFYGRNVKLF